MLPYFVSGVKWIPQLFKYNSPFIPNEAPPSPTPQIEYQNRYVPEYEYVSQDNTNYQNQLNQQQNQLNQQTEKINSLEQYQQNPDSTHCIMSGGVPQSDGSCMNSSK